ncbi:MAG: hypothetical protein JO256_00760 [Alphaproteobacteria bacterium]|nr:hypothetical protein [Alphaproteobacteria bacterium]
MSKSAKPSSRSFTLGRRGFAKISAVEGIRLDRETLKTFRDFDAKKLSAKTRREALIAKFSAKP